jgi:hypothetical protein
MAIQGLKHGSFNNMDYWEISTDIVSLLVNLQKKKKKKKHIFVTVGSLMQYTTEYQICNSELCMAERYNCSCNYTS